MTGTEGGLGRALAQRLAQRDDVAGLVEVAGLAELAGAVAAGRLTDVGTLVHLATTYDVALPAAERRASNVGGTAHVLEAARSAGVRRVVLMTSADVWGALPDNPVPLADASPRHAEGDDETLLGDHVEVERLAEHAARSGMATTVLRPATLVGGALGPAYDGQLLRRLGAPRLLALRGVEPLWQLCHVEDLLAALELASAGLVTGALGVGCEGALEQSRVEQLSGRPRIELPAAVARASAERLHRVGVTTSSARELDHLLAPLVVACDGLRTAGWAPAWTNEAALVAHLATRADDGRSAAAVTAAGATVAVLGTAALLRRTRRRRRRV